MFDFLKSFLQYFFREAVKTGVLQNENIMIHIGQNLFNFVFTTLAWFTVSQIYSFTTAISPTRNLSTGRNMRALTISEAAEEVMEAMLKFESR